MAMNFRPRRIEEPEINLVPFIDVLLVVLIFLMLTTTFSRLAELKINLPTANAQMPIKRPHEISVIVAADGRYAINGQTVDGRSVDVLSAQLRSAAQGDAKAIIVISADAASAHQSVINVMDAARRAGLQQLSFATQNTSGGSNGS